MWSINSQAEALKFFIQMQNIDRENFDDEA